MHSMPFGSSFEYTKQLNAALNCSPHGPCAIPPRQGQSQFISPVSSLKAPSWEASASVSSMLGSGEAVVLGLMDEDGVSEGVDGVGGAAFWRREGAIDSRVGSGVSSGGDWGVAATGNSISFSSPSTRA